MLYLLMIIIVIIDGLITYYVPSYFNMLNYLYPMLSITFLVSIYKYSNNYLKNCLILGLIYDLFYSNIFLYNTLIFLILGKTNKKITNFFRPTLFLKTLLVVIDIILYELINYIVILWTKYNFVSINDLLYKISHSLILNIMSLFVFTFILNKLTIKHKLK